MLDIEGLNAAPESPTVVKRVAETQPEAETQKKAKTAAPGVDPSFETTAAPAFDPSFGVRAPVAGLTEPSTGEEDAESEDEEDAEGRIIDELVELFTEKHGRPPTEDEVSMWVQQMRELTAGATSGAGGEEDSDEESQDEIDDEDQEE